MTSLSLVDWKIAPCCSRSAQRDGVDQVAVVYQSDGSVGAHVLTTIGWAFPSLLSPAVE